MTELKKPSVHSSPESFGAKTVPEKVHLGEVITLELDDSPKRASTLVWFSRKLEGTEWSEPSIAKFAVIWKSIWPDMFSARVKKIKGDLFVIVLVTAAVITTMATLKRARQK